MSKVIFTSLNSGRVCQVEGDILPYNKASDRIVIRNPDTKQYEDVLVSTIIEIEDDYSKDKK